jgi:hypothetical protein
MQPIMAQDDLLVNQQKLMLIAVVLHIAYSFFLSVIFVKSKSLMFVACLHCTVLF